MGRGHRAGFSILCSHRHHHHRVGGGCVWYLQPQAPPGGLVLFQVNPGEVGGEGETGFGRRSKMEILRARKAGDAEAKRGRGAWCQETPGTAELQQDRNYSTGLGGHPVQAPSHSVLANQLQGEGSRGGQKGGRQRGSKETSFWGSPGLQRHLAQFSTLRDPSEDHMGEVRQRASRASSGAQPCHFYQQLGLETWIEGRRGEQRWA